MSPRSTLVFEERTIADLSIIDEKSFKPVAIYADLKEILRGDKYSFRVLSAGSTARWDRTLFLNLTYWSAGGGDVLESHRIEADVVAHAAWHHLTALAFAGNSQSAQALFLGESIASAFDVYLVGRLLGQARRSSFLESQVPAMAESAKAAGMSARAFEALLEGIADDPEGAFAQLRQLLYDVAITLLACSDATEAAGRAGQIRQAPLRSACAPLRALELGAVRPRLLEPWTQRPSRARPRDHASPPAVAPHLAYVAVGPSETRLEEESGLDLNPPDTRAAPEKGGRVPAAAVTADACPAVSTLIGSVSAPLSSQTMTTRV
jgi:hypothetical protein